MQEVHDLLLARCATERSDRTLEGQNLEARRSGRRLTASPNGRRKTRQGRIRLLAVLRRQTETRGDAAGARGVGTLERGRPTGSLRSALSPRPSASWRGARREVRKSPRQPQGLAGRGPALEPVLAEIVEKLDRLVPGSIGESDIGALRSIEHEPQVAKSDPRGQARRRPRWAGRRDVAQRLEGYLARPRRRPPRFSSRSQVSTAESTPS